MDALKNFVYRIREDWPVLNANREALGTAKAVVGTGLVLRGSVLVEYLPEGALKSFMRGAVPALGFYLGASGFVQTVTEFDGAIE